MRDSLEELQAQRERTEKGIKQRLRIAVILIVVSALCVVVNITLLVARYWR